MSTLEEVTAERDRLAQWKSEMLTVKSWWAKVDEAVRKHPETRAGELVSEVALRLINERDEFKKLSEEALAIVEQYQSASPRPI